MIGGKVSAKFGGSKFKQFQNAILRAADQSGAIAALEVRNEAVYLIRDNSDGEKQKRYSPERTVKVSPPGEPPNSDTGRLIGSIFFDKIETAKYKVGTKLPYGKHLEYGTENMAARPWLSVALKNTSEKIQKIIREGYEAVIARYK